MEPWQSWTVLGFATAGAYWYYSNQYKAKRGPGRVPFSSEQAQARTSRSRNGSKGGRTKETTSGASDQFASDAADLSSTSLPGSGAERAKKRKGGKSQPSQLAKNFATEVNNETEVDLDIADDREEGLDNKEFAKQLSGLKTGTSLNAPTKSGGAFKTNKQGNSNTAPIESSKNATAEGNVALSSHMSTASSTAGDADDDLSPAVSPIFGATEGSKGPGDVTDMLKKPAAGPSILRLTEPTGPQRVAQPKQQKATQVQETKKQRQNRQKNEEKKLAREQAEKERRILLEKQLRTAREAEGRPAKNGVVSSKQPTTKAWGKSAAEGPTALAEVKDAPLLDTFDENTPSATHTKSSVIKDMSAGGKVWDRDVPSEEEQMRMLNEMENGGWNTVEKGRKTKKKAVKVDSSSVEVQGSESSDAGSAQNQQKPPVHNPDFPYALTGHPNDSDWAVV
ncbi:hypothetical protein MMC12_002694 [Toensbergia leucococca]|nr:hypothetical protein [Toensbergia leucococca]